MNTESQMVASLVVLLKEQFNDMLQAGLDCWDDGRSPLEHGGKLFCGTASEFSPLGMAYASEPLPVWQKVRAEFEASVKGNVFVEWNDETDEASLSFSW